MSFDPLIEKIRETGNPTAVGLDADFANIPECLKSDSVKNLGETLDAAAQAVYVFNVGLIDALYDIVPAVKIQSAYYEKYGWQGVRTLSRTVEYAKAHGLFVIVDGKRNDIGTTMEAYAAAYLGTAAVGKTEIESFGADALTVNGYLGTDGISPLLETCAENGKGIFVLVKTSNPSSGELQDKTLESNVPVYEYMGGLCEKWGENLRGKYGYSAVGAVVGATYPEQLKKLRRQLPHTFFLVPGYGAQGGGGKDAAGAFDQRGLGAVINASRSIIYAYKKQGCPEADYAAAARREAIRMKNDITAAIG